MQLTLNGALAVLAHAAFAQTWQTVDDAYVGDGAYALCMAKDPFGNIYAGGSIGDTNSNYLNLAAVRKSSDGGVTWTTVDMLGLAPADPLDVYETRGIAVDPAGAIYAVGGAYGPGNWFVRRSLDSGATWQTVDLPGGSAEAVATDASGNVFAAGIRSGGGWLVRKSADGGNSWSTVDTFGSSRANGIFCHPNAGVFVVGYANVTSGTGKKTTTQAYWYVRRSLDQGTTWATVDAYLGGTATCVGADPSGSLYAAGNNQGHWIVRKSSNGGSSWATVDDFFPCVSRTQCSSAQAAAFAADTHGNLFVAGSMRNTSTGKYTWVVRENLGGNGAWQTVDSYSLGAGYSSDASGAVADDFGNVFVAGTDGIGAWLVRRN